MTTPLPFFFWREFIFKKTLFEKSKKNPYLVHHPVQGRRDPGAVAAKVPINICRGNGHGSAVLPIGGRGVVVVVVICCAGIGVARTAISSPIRVAVLTTDRHVLGPVRLLWEQRNVIIWIIWEMKLNKQKDIKNKISINKSVEQIVARRTC